MVCPRLKYSSTVWDRHLSSDIHALEQVQQCPHTGTSSAMSSLIRPSKLYLAYPRMCDKHGSEPWVEVPPTKTQYGQAYISMLFKIQHRLVDISPEFVQPGDSSKRGSQHIPQLEANKDVYRYSFYPQTISDWNRLSISVTNSQTIQGLREALACLPPTLHLHWIH